MRRIAIAVALAAAAAAPTAAQAGSVSLSDPQVGSSSTLYRMIVRDDDPAVAGGRRFDVRLSWARVAGGRIAPTIRAYARVGATYHSLGLFRVANPEASLNRLPPGTRFVNFTPIVITTAGFSFQVRVREPGKAAHTFGWIAVDRTHMGSAG